MFDFNPLSSRNWRATLIGILTFSIVLWSATNIPGLAVDAIFSPESPRLGETIIVNMSGSVGKMTKPTVKVGEKIYPVFRSTIIDFEQ